MDHISIPSQSQDPVHVQSKIDDFFGRFKIATLEYASITAIVFALWTDTSEGAFMLIIPIYRNINKNAIDTLSQAVSEPV
jgi:hypothetical protein